VYDALAGHRPPERLLAGARVTGLAPDEDDAILAQLIAHAGPEARDGLLAFRSLIAARQYRPLYRLFRGVVPRGARVLDWGAGNGHFSHFLVRAGYEATAFGFTPFALSGQFPAATLRFARGHPSEPAKLPFADASFDAVSSVGVLEHVRETGGTEAASLGEIARVLVPGGHLVAWHLPNRISWIEWLARRLPDRHHHTHRFEAADVRALVHAAGLEVLELWRYGFLPRNVWGRFPQLGASVRLADLWGALDEGVARLLPAVCQNWAFVARKPGPTPG